MSTVAMHADLRQNVGGGSSRNLLRDGKVPAVIYGNKKENILVSLVLKEITNLFHSGCLTSTVIDLNLNDHEGKTSVHKVLVREIQLDPVKDSVIHADLVFLNDASQEVSVPLSFENRERCIGIKRGGFFNILHRKVKLLCSGDNIPQKINVDVLNMRVGQKLTAGKIQLPEGVQLALSPETILVSITGRGKADADEAKEGEGK